jgi:hypothetical protein
MKKSFENMAVEQKVFTDVVIAPILARSTTLEHSICRIIGGKLGPIRREGLTKVEARLKAASISRTYEARSSIVTGRKILRTFASDSRGRSRIPEMGFEKSPPKNSPHARASPNSEGLQR